MDKIRSIRTFVTIAQNGSLTEAALRLDCSLPTVVRHLADLEASLGVKLFKRTTRRVDLTAEGRTYLEHCERMLADLAAVEARMVRPDSRPAGRVAVTAPVLFGELHVAPVLTDLADMYPELRVRLHLEDRLTDLVDGHYDLAVRIGHLPDSGMMARRIGEVRQVLCAAPSLIARVGRPLRPETLHALPCLRNDGNTAGGLWPFIDHETGNRISVRIAGSFTSNFVRPLLRSCLAGNGFGLFLSYQVADHVRSGALEELLPEWQPEPLPVHLVHSYGRRVPPRVITVLERMAEALRARLAGFEAQPA